MTEQDYTVRIKTYDRQDSRLGRNVRHDSRSLSYQVEPVSLDALISVRHTRYIPILDQGSVGSCTGNAATGNLGSGSFWNSLNVQHSLSETDVNADEQFALSVYEAATQLDPWPGTYPPDDTGSDGLSVAKVLQQRGFLSGYLHATSLDAFLTALAVQPVIVGTEWRNDMFNPAPDGRIRITGDVAGGHEYVFTELDVENQRVWMDNSWTTQWGIQGRGYYSWDDIGMLLTADGDCTVFVPISAPAPAPIDPTPLDPVTVFERRVHRAVKNFVSTFV